MDASDSMQEDAQNYVDLLCASCALYPHYVFRSCSSIVGGRMNLVPLPRGGECGKFPLGDLSDVSHI